ncbi:MAG: radical SAM protein [Thiotrichales bacterium]|mgnify:CR=1 FL=1|nr:radical SAM protein [Thiotrichales bacterium]MBT4261171.1 radical SAM protein [Thiotrichales bacterium]
MRQLGYEYDYSVPAYFAVSKYCNIDCTYCYLPDDFKNQKVDIDAQALESISRLIDKAKRERFVLESAYLHGAEPTTLSPEALSKAVEMLSEITLMNRISVQTNGVAVNRSYLKRMGEMQDRVAFGYSVDLPPAAHNKNRSKTYNKVIENIGIARDLGYSHRLLVCVNQDTMEDLPAVLSEIEKLHREFPSMTIAFKHIKGDQQISDDQKVEWADFLADNGLHDYDHSIWGKICHVDGNNCWWFEFCADGGVTACNKSYNDEGKFANWMEDPMSNIILKRQTLYQNNLVPQECFGCEYWSICKGGCPADRYDDNGTVTLDCAIKKRIYSRMKSSGINPLSDAKNIPRFTRQIEYRKWKETGKKFGFIGEENV